jgi:TPR repeat protein
LEKYRATPVELVGQLIRSHIQACIPTLLQRLVIILGAVTLLAGTFTIQAAEINTGVASFERGDYVKSLRIFRRLAGQGDARAQFMLGVMFDEGRGVPRDYTEAAKWYQQAAEQGEVNAQFNLGIMSGKGHGVPKDYVLAHMWLTLAAARGVKEAEYNRDIIAGRMTPEQIGEAQRLAREWKPRGK